MLIGDFIRGYIYIIYIIHTEKKVRYVFVIYRNFLLPFRLNIICFNRSTAKDDHGATTSKINRIGGKKRKIIEKSQRETAVSSQ